jgi:hypothetical protein
MSTTPNFRQRHRRKIIAAALFLIAAIIALWWWHARDQPSFVQKKVKVQVANSKSGALTAEERTIKVPRTLSVPDRELTDEEFRTIEDEQEIEVCDKGVVQQKELSRYLIQDGAATDGMIAASAELRRSTDVIDQATGLAAAVLAACNEAEIFNFPELRRSCKNDRIDVNAALNELTQLANRTKDPSIYALALDTCTLHFYRRCEGLSDAALTEIDRGNLIPMIVSAPYVPLTNGVETAPQPGLDVALRDASRVTTYRFRLDRLLATQAFQALSPTYQAIAAAGVMRHSVEEDYNVEDRRLIRYCDAMPQEAWRREQCGRIADLRMRDATSVVAAKMAARFGEAGAWSAQKLAAAKALRAQLFVLDTEKDYRPINIWSCEGVQKSLKDMKQRAGASELDLYREKLKARGVVMIEPRDIAAMK